MDENRSPLAGAIGMLLCLGLVGCAPTLAGRGVPQPFPGSPRPPAVASVAPAGTVPALVGTALSFRGVRYRLGGDQPESGFDCSGFVRFVFRQHAVVLPRTVAEQVEVGDRIDRDHLAPGDLIFFSTTAPGASHVGIVVDDSTFVHAPGTGAVVRTERFDTAYWRARVLDYRRVVATGG